MSSSLVMYTDGACSGNPGPGGWAVCWQDSDGKWVCKSGKSLDTTNNRMELMAFLYALALASKLVRDGEASSVDIRVDSAYVCNAVNQGWVRKWASNEWRNKGFRQVKNTDVWKHVLRMLDDSETMRCITVSKVDGHSGLEGNEVADRYAVGARDDAVFDRMIADDSYRPPQTFRRGIRRDNNSKLR